MFGRKKISDVKKPKKRMRSIWIVLITALLTSLTVGGGFATYIYWQDNFSEKLDVAQGRKEEKIEGENIVAATSNNGKIYLTYYNTENGKTIIKNADSGVTVQGGKWSKDNKNEILQFSEDGENFVVLEVKEPSMSDDSEFARFVRYGKDGSNKEVILEDKNYLAYGNFIYMDNKIYYLSSVYKDREIKSWNMSVLDIETKKTNILAENIGDFFETELSLANNKIYSTYSKNGSVYESVLDIDSKNVTKTNLFRLTNSKDFQLEISEVYPSPNKEKYIFKDYSAKEGYGLKVYDKATKKTQVLLRDKDYELGSVNWITDNEVIFKKEPVFVSSDVVSKESIVSMDISDTTSVKIVAESEKVLRFLGKYLDNIMYSEEKKVFAKKEETKEFTPVNFADSSDLLFIDSFDYSD